jgi:hypothetical protein
MPPSESSGSSGGGGGMADSGGRSDTPERVSPPYEAAAWLDRTMALTTALGGAWLGVAVEKGRAGSGAAASAGAGAIGLGRADHDREAHLVRFQT